MSEMSAGTLPSVSNDCSTAPVSALSTYTLCPLEDEVHDVVALSVSSQASMPPPTITTGFAPELQPLMKAAFGTDQVLPMPVAPDVQLLSSTEAQPNDHLK